MVGKYKHEASLMSPYCFCCSLLLWLWLFLRVLKNTASTVSQSSALFQLVYQLHQSSSLHHCCCCCLNHRFGFELGQIQFYRIGWFKKKKKKN
jgi:hypothetical protein